jgi:hypothetical protein
VIDSSDCPTWEIGADSFVSSQPVFLRWIASELHLALKAIARGLVPVGAIAFRSIIAIALDIAIALNTSLNLIRDLTIGAMGNGRMTIASPVVAGCPSRRSVARGDSFLIARYD